MHLKFRWIHKIIAVSLELKTRLVFERVTAKASLHVLWYTLNSTVTMRKKLIIVIIINTYLWWWILVFNLWEIKIWEASISLMITGEVLISWRREREKRRWERIKRRKKRFIKWVRRSIVEEREGIREKWKILSPIMFWGWMWVESCGKRIEIRRHRINQRCETIVCDLNDGNCLWLKNETKRKCLCVWWRLESFERWDQSIIVWVFCCHL